MKNCLIEKTNSIVNNSELPLFNSRIFNLEDSVSGNLYLNMPSKYNGSITFSDGVTVSAKNGNPLSNQVSIPNDENDYITISSSNGGTALFTSFDKLVYFGFRWEFKNIDIVEFAPCLNITHIGNANANLTGDIREFAEKQISYGRTSGTIFANGQTLRVDGTISTTNTITINSTISYTINSDTWNLINGVWVKQ